MTEQTNKAIIPNKSNNIVDQAGINSAPNTEEKEEPGTTGGYMQVYKSNDEIPFGIEFVPKGTKVNWPLIAEAPNSNLKSPKYNWIKHEWFEYDQTTQGQKLAEISKQVQQLSKDVNNGKISNEALNQQLGTLVGLVSQSAIAQQAAQPSTDDKADSTATEDGGAK